MNIHDEFPSKYLKASDIEQDVTVTMRDVQREDVGDDRKPVLYVEEFDKGIVLNKTNANNIAEVYGPNTDQWRGGQMTLATAMVDFQGRSTRALRLYPPPRQSSNAPINNGSQQYDERNPPPRDNY